MRSRLGFPEERRNKTADLASIDRNITWTPPCQQYALFSISIPNGVSSSIQFLRLLSISSGPLAAPALQIPRPIELSLMHTASGAGPSLKSAWKYGGGKCSRADAHILDDGDNYEAGERGKWRNRNTTF